MGEKVWLLDFFNYKWPMEMFENDESNVCVSYTYNDY